MEPLIQTGPRYISYVTLRRLAPRSARILNEHKDKDPTIHVMNDTLAPVIERYVAAYDLHQVRRAVRTAKTATARAKIEKLDRTVARWLAVLASDLDADASVIRPQTDVPDDVIAGGAQFVSLVEAHVASSDAPHPGAERALEDLRAGVAEARESWAEARLAIIELQEDGQNVRDLASELHAGLVKVRRVLGHVLGRRHLDYQALRLRRGTADDPAGDEAADVDADVVPAEEPEPKSSPRAASGENGVDDGELDAELDAVAGE